MTALRGGGHEINKPTMLRIGYGLMKTYVSFLCALTAESLELVRRLLLT
jgi:hypothetical protein